MEIAKFMAGGLHVIVSLRVILREELTGNKLTTRKGSRTLISQAVVRQGLAWREQ
jgi:hypothetical protein